MRFTRAGPTAQRWGRPSARDDRPPGRAHRAHHALRPHGLGRGGQPRLHFVVALRGVDDSVLEFAADLACRSHDLLSIQCVKVLGDTE